VSVFGQPARRRRKKSPFLTRTRAVAAFLWLSGALVATPCFGQEPPSAEEEAAKLFQRAKGSFAANDHDAAMRDLSAAIAKDPNNAEYYEARGSTWLFLGSHRAAVTDLDTAVRLGRNTPMVLVYRAQAFLHLQDYEKALRDFDQALALQPANSVIIRMARLEAYYSLNRMQELAAEADAVLKVDPDNTNALNYRGLASRDRKDLVAARRDFERALAINPRSATALYNRGAVNNDEGRVDEAIADFTAALTVSGPDAMTLAARARGYMQQQKSELAITDLKESLALDADVPDVHGNLAQLLVDDPARIFEAYYHADEAVGLAPGRGDLLRTRGRILLDLGRQERAARDFSAAIKTDPKDALAYAYRAGATFQKDPDAGFADVTKALELDPKCGPAFIVRGMHAVEHGRWAEGVRDLEKGIELGWGSASAYYHLAIAYGTSRDDRVRDGAKALSYAQKVPEGLQGAPRAGPVARAVAYAEQGDFGKATECVKQAMAGASAEEQAHLKEMAAAFEKGLPIRAPRTHPSRPADK
jgi:tetratricopeptide (TPR) repeat protein